MVADTHRPADVPAAGAALTQITGETDSNDTASQRTQADPAALPDSQQGGWNEHATSISGRWRI
jgi:hypothetical protein